MRKRHIFCADAARRTGRCAQAAALLPPRAFYARTARCTGLPAAAALLSGCAARRQAASVGIIGGADGPTAIYITSSFSPLAAAAAVAVAAAAALVALVVLARRRRRAKKQGGARQAADAKGRTGRQDVSPRAGAGREDTQQKEEKR